MDITTVIPPALRQGLQVATRHLYHGRQVGRVTVLIRHHDGSGVVHERILPDRFAIPNRLQSELAAETRALNLACLGHARLGRQRIAGGQVFAGRSDLQAEAGFIECSLNCDGLTARRLADLGCWPEVDEPLAHDDAAGLCAAYLALFADCADPGCEPSSVLRRAVALLDRIACGIDPAEAGDDFADRAQRLLRSNCEAGFSLHEAAARLGLPYDRFRRAFKRTVGLSPGDYQLRQRMLRACELLLQHGVAECAQRLGYSEASAFSRQFKQLTGLPPSRYAELSPSSFSGAPADS